MGCKTKRHGETFPPPLARLWFCKSQAVFTFSDVPFRATLSPVFPLQPVKTPKDGKAK